MRGMKRVLSIILIICMAAVFCGCGFVMPELPGFPEQQEESSAELADGSYEPQALPMPALPSAGQAEEPAANSPSSAGVTELLNQLMDLLKGRYWNAGKTPEELKAAVDAGDFSAEGLGLTEDGCPGAYPGTSCSSNAFRCGAETTGYQGKGFTQFLAYLLFGEDGDVTGWESFSGIELNSTEIEPGDRIATSTQSAIVWKVEGSDVYVVECRNRYTDGVCSGCYISYGSFGGDAELKNIWNLRTFLRAADGGVIQKHPGSGAPAPLPGGGISIYGATIPEMLYEGQSFDIQGTVIADRGVITDLFGAILDADGNVLQNGEYYPNEASAELGYTVNNNLFFGALAPGDYIYYVFATARIDGTDTTVVLIKSPFSVIYYG